MTYEQLSDEELYEERQLTMGKSEEDARILWFCKARRLSVKQD